VFVIVVLLRALSNTAIGNSGLFYALWVQGANPRINRGALYISLERYGYICFSCEENSYFCFLELLIVL